MNNNTDQIMFACEWCFSVEICSKRNIHKQTSRYGRHYFSFDYNIWILHVLQRTCTIYI